MSISTSMCHCTPWYRWMSLTCIVVLASVPWLRKMSPLKLREEALCALELRYGEDLFRNSWHLMRNALESAKCAMLLRPPRSVDPACSRAMLEFVAAWLPSRVIVHPTEEFVYFDFFVMNQLYRGNLRIADLAKPQNISVMVCARDTWANVGSRAWARFSSSGCDSRKVSDRAAGAEDRVHSSSNADRGSS